MLGHELTHVVQQKAGRVPVPQAKGTPINADPTLEAEADDLGAKAAQGKSVTVTGASSGVQQKSAETIPIQRFNLFSKIANTVKDNVSSAVNTVKSGVNTVTNKVSNGFNTVKEGLKNVNLRDVGHDALDVAGFIPVVGAVADVANASWYLAEGDYTKAALSGISAIPGIGDAIGGVAKGGKAAFKLAKGSNMLGKANKLLPNAGKLVGKAGGLANKVSSSAGKLVGKVGGLANKIPPGIKSVTGKVMGGLKSIPTKVKRGLNAAKDKIVGGAKRGFNYDTFENTASYRGTANDARDAALALAEGNFAKAALSGFSALPGITNAIGFVGKRGKAALARVKGSKLYSPVMNIAEGVGTTVNLEEARKKAAKGDYGKAAIAALSAIPGLRKGGSAVFNMAKRNQRLKNALSKTKGGFTSLPNKVKGGFNAFKGKVKGGFNTVKGKVKDGFNTVKGKFKGGLSAAKNKLNRGVNGLNNKLRRGKGKPNAGTVVPNKASGTKTPGAKPKRDLPMTTKEQNVLNNTASNRGYRPKPGERSMTRESSKEQRRQSRIRRRMQRLEAEGHGPARHGSQLTEQQLIDRATLGHDPVTGTTDDAYNKFPDGTPKTHKYGRHATKVNTDEAYVQAEARIKNSQQFKDETAAADAEGRTRTEAIEMSLEDIYGSDYKKKVYGKTRLGSANNPTGTTDTDFTDSKMRAYYEKDASGNWRLITMYPNPQ